MVSLAEKARRFEMFWEVAHGPLNLRRQYGL